MKTDPDQLQLEIPLQNENFQSLRLLEVFVNEQAMMGFPVCGHITQEQFDQVAGWLGAPGEAITEGEKIYLPVEKNPDFYLKVVTRGDHPGTDYFDKEQETADPEGVYVPPVFDPKTGIPQDTPSSIKPADPEGEQAPPPVTDPAAGAALNENKEEKTDEIPEDQRPS